MESQRVQRLKLAVHPLAFNLFLCLFITALFLAVSPAIGLAQLNPIIYAPNNGGSPPCDVGCFSPDGGDIQAYTTPDQVSGATAFVGDLVQWGHVGLTGTPVSVTASTTQGDYQGHTCPEPGGLDGYLATHEDTYRHRFIMPQDCYYRDIYRPPGTGYASYPGAQGVIHVLPTTGPSAYWLMPVNISTVPSVAQTFTAFYVDPGGYANLSDTSLTLTGVSDVRLHYNPATNALTLNGASGSCTPGQSATLTSGEFARFMTLDCSGSSVLASGVFLQVTYNLIPAQTLSGQPYKLTVAATEMGGATSTKTLGTWIINLPPSVGTTSPMNSTTPVGTQQTFTAVYSDPDGYQNIAVANFYMSGNGGVINQWLHYLVAPNVFTLLGTNDFCNPGQAKTLSNGSLSLNCATSTISGSGTNLTIVFQVTPLSDDTGGITYQFFNATSDQAGANFAAFGGSWMIP